MGFTSKYVIPFLVDNPSVFVLSVIVGCISVLYLLFFKKKEQYHGIKKSSTDPSEVIRSEFEETLSEEDPNIAPPLFEEDLAHVPFEHKRYSMEVSLRRSQEFYEMMNERRSLRFFSSDPVDKRIIENLIRSAGTSPSGAHTEPWTYVAVEDPKVKEGIRELVEKEEEINYLRRMGSQWTDDLKFLHTTWVKEYLTEAPWLIVVFRQAYFPLPDGHRRVHYYNEISTALSAGIFLAAIQNAGLVTLTSTPLNCGAALRDLLGRPSYEKLLLLLPVGYPKNGATVPNLNRKPIKDVMVVI